MAEQHPRTRSHSQRFDVRGCDDVRLVEVLLRGGHGHERPALDEIPDETAGPYPGDGSNGPDVLEESGIVRSDIRSSIDVDAPVERASDLHVHSHRLADDDAPYANAAVYAWHCDAQGRYSSDNVFGDDSRCR